MKVHNHFAGHIVIVQLDEKFNHYITTTKDIRKPGFIFIEAIKNGQVYYRETCFYNETPEILLKFIRRIT